MGMSNLDGYHPNKNESYQLGYQQGRADERAKAFDEVDKYLRELSDIKSGCGEWIEEHDEQVRANEREEVIDELKPFFDEVAEYTLDWICDDLCGEFINPITDECWCAEHCKNGTGYECIKKWCELKNKS